MNATNNILQLSPRAVPPGHGRTHTLAPKVCDDSASRSASVAPVAPVASKDVQGTVSGSTVSVQDSPKAHESSGDKTSGSPHATIDTTAPGTTITATRKPPKLPLRQVRSERSEDKDVPDSRHPVTADSLSASAAQEDGHEISTSDSSSDKTPDSLKITANRKPKVQLKSSGSATQTDVAKATPAPEEPVETPHKTASGSARKPKVQLKTTTADASAKDAAAPDTSSAETASSTSNRKPKVQLKTTAPEKNTDANVAQPDRLATKTSTQSAADKDDCSDNESLTASASPSTAADSSSSPNDHVHVAEKSSTTPEATEQSETNSDSRSASLSAEEAILASLTKSSRSVRANIIEFINRQGKPSTVIVEPLGSIGVRLALLGKDGIFGDQVVNDPQQAQKIIESLEFLDTAQWDRKTTSLMRIMPYHWYKMAGWVARSHRFPKYRKKTYHQKQEQLEQENEEITCTQ